MKVAHEISSWMWTLLTPYLSIRDALPLLRTSKLRVLTCITHKSRGLWNPCALGKMPSSLFLQHNCLPSSFALCLTELIERCARGLTFRGNKEFFEFYLWFKHMPTKDIHIVLKEGEHAPPSQYEAGRRSAGDLHSCMSDSNGNLRQDNVFVITQTPFEMLNTSGVLQTDMDFGTSRGSDKQISMGTLNQGLVWLQRLKEASDVALVLRLNGLFGLAGGDGSIDFDFCYVSTRGTLVLVSRHLCEYPVLRTLSVKEWHLDSQSLDSALQNLARLLSGEFSWDVSIADTGTIVNSVIMNSPHFPQYEIGDRLA